MVLAPFLTLCFVNKIYHAAALIWRGATNQTFFLKIIEKSLNDVNFLEKYNVQKNLSGIFTEIKVLIFKNLRKNWFKFMHRVI
jgi:hypothetical protein